jgi:hypothetical protein
MSLDYKLINKSINKVILSQNKDNQGRIYGFSSGVDIFFKTLNYAQMLIQNTNPCPHIFALLGISPKGCTYVHTYVPPLCVSLRTRQITF